MAEIVFLKDVIHPVYFNLIFERTAGFRGASRAFVAPHVSKGWTRWPLKAPSNPDGSVVQGSVVPDTLCMPRVISELGQADQHLLLQKAEFVGLKLIQTGLAV